MKVYKKYKQQINYLIFGGLTTLINILTYIFFYDMLDYSNLFSNIIAWILSVLFAYITNKLWVFESKSTQIKILFKEFISFITCRLFTGLLDIFIMYLTVDLLNLNALFMKIISNILVIILNYIASKIIIFKNN